MLKRLFNSLITFLSKRPPLHLAVYAVVGSVLLALFAANYTTYTSSDSSVSSLPVVIPGVQILAFVWPFLCFYAYLTRPKSN